MQLPPIEPPLLLSVVIPVYNELAYIEEILARVQASDRFGCGLEIVVVDDCSTDGTRELLQELQPKHPSMKLVHQAKNEGKGAALRRGFAMATGHIVLVQDADLEYSPTDYPALLQPILSGEADVVYGSRFLGGPHRVLYYWHSVGNWILTNASNTCTNLSLTDMETCYKVFKAEYFKKVEIRSNRFDFEPEITAKILKQRVRLIELPISYFGRDYAEGKKITWRDGFAAIFALVKFRFMD